MGVRKINVPGLARMPAFCHAVVAGDFIFVSGTLGTKSDSMELIEGGTGRQTTQALKNIETILAACGATLADVAKINVYLRDMNTFPEMNRAYQAIMGDDPPARMTVGRGQFALGAAVEIDCTAHIPVRQGKRP
ncbi:MAG: RidA family protein [Gammaproteobacteria bacterium]